MSAKVCAAAPEESRDLQVEEVRCPHGGRSAQPAGHTLPLTALGIHMRSPGPWTRALHELVAGARFAPDSDRAPDVTVRWLYAGVKQGAREMVRVGWAV